MSVSTQFAAQAARAHPSLEGLLGALAVEVREYVPPGLVRLGIDRLSRRLRRTDPDPATALEALGARVVAGFRVVGPGESASDLDALRPDVVLDRREGDALLVAALAVAAGRRHGWDVGVVLTEDGGVHVGHQDLDAPYVVAVREQGRLVDASELGEGDLWWATPHAVVRALVERLADRAPRLGDVGVHVRALELALTLPADPVDRGRQTVELARARAALN